ncbi:hypothetical protein F7R05_14835 [Pseudomonas koreensis]|nr:hypothetical protein F7R05_14835 [Pseudomonas koreensis]
MFESEKRVGKHHLWRGSLLPLGCEADPKPASPFLQVHRMRRNSPTASPSGSKLPRHRVGLASYRSVVMAEMDD